MNARKTFWGLAGVALIAATGLFAAACGSSPSNPTPATTGSTSGSGSGATSGATTGASGTTTSGASTGAAEASTGASGSSSGATTDGGIDATMQTTDGGDGGTTVSPEAAACNPTGAVYPSDACAPCAANLLNACSTFNVTCFPFDNSVVPDAHF
jgi:hypothetical protein